MTDPTETFMYALLWTCTSCGFVQEGGQPKMECPICAAYKTNFIAFPQHLEAKIRETFSEIPPNHRDSRAMRKEMIIENQLKLQTPFAGRVLPSASGNAMDHLT